MGITAEWAISDAFLVALACPSEVAADSSPAAPGPDVSGMVGDAELLLVMTRASPQGRGIAVCFGAVEQPLLQLRTELWLAPGATRIAPGGPPCSACCAQRLTLCCATPRRRGDSGGMGNFGCVREKRLLLK